MAKLVDALVSGTSVSNDVQVRVLFWAPPKAKSTRQKVQGKGNTAVTPTLRALSHIAQMVKLVDTPA
jgi:hypothetical protein